MAIMGYPEGTIQKRGKNMNFHNKKTRKIMAIVIIVIVAAMVVTAVLPAMMV